MATSFKLTDGTTEYNLVYNAGLQEAYLTHYGLEVNAGQADVRYHKPDYGESVPISATDEDITIVATMDIDGADWDAVETNVNQLKRFVDGAHSQAVRYWIKGDVSPVYFRGQLDGATNHYDLIVKSGHVDDSEAFYDQFAENAQTARGCIIQLTCAPYAVGQSQTLRNDLVCSAGFTEDSDADGLADGWVLLGTPATTIETTDPAQGGSCQKLVTDNATEEGIRSPVITMTQGDTATGYVWVAGESGGDILTIGLVDGGGNTIVNAFFLADSPAGHDKTKTVGGRTWYRYVVSGSSPTNSDFTLRVYRGTPQASAISTYYVDMCYAEADQSVAPDFWIGSSTISNETGDNLRPFIDVAQITGTVPAVADWRLKLTTKAGSPASILGAVLEDGRYNASDYIYWEDAQAFDYYFNFAGSWSTIADTSRHGDNYRRYTTSTGGGTTLFQAVLSGLTDDQIKQHLRTSARLYLLARASSTTSSMYISNDGSMSGLDKTVKFPVANSWVLIDLASLLPVDLPLELYATLPEPRVRFSLTVTEDNGTVELDGLYWLPVSEKSFIRTDDNQAMAVNNSTYISGTHERVGVDAAFLPNHHTGGMWTLPSGRGARVFFQTTDEVANAHYLGNKYEATVTITPRSRHVIGTD